MSSSKSVLLSSKSYRLLKIENGNGKLTTRSIRLIWGILVLSYSQICNNRGIDISGEVGKIWQRHNVQSVIFTVQIMSANNYSFFYYTHFRPRSHYFPIQSQ